MNQISQRRFASALAVVVAVALIAGCAGPSSTAATSARAASAGDLAGTWTGEFWILGGFYYPNDGTIFLQIKEDGTYTVTLTPKGGANNIAKPAKWSGTVVQNGRYVVFRASREPWSGTWSSLAGSGDTLYGVANDPSTETDIGIKVERARPGA